MGNNIYGSGTEEMCVVWLTNVTDTLPFYNIEEKKLATLVFLLGQLYFLNYVFFYVGHICQFWRVVILNYFKKELQSWNIFKIPQIIHTYPKF